MGVFREILCFLLIFGFCNGLPTKVSSTDKQVASSLKHPNPIIPATSFSGVSGGEKGKAAAIAFPEAKNRILTQQRMKRANSDDDDVGVHAILALFICILLIIIIILILCAGCHFMKVLAVREFPSYTTDQEIAYIKKLQGEDVIVKRPSWRERFGRLNCFRKRDTDKDTDTVDIKDKEVIQKITFTETQSAPRVSTLERIQQASQAQLTNLRSTCARICTRPAEEEPSQPVVPQASTTTETSTTNRTWTRGLQILRKEESGVQKTSAEIEQEAQKKREEHRLREVEKMRKAEETAERKRKERVEKEETLKMKKEKERLEAEEKKKLKNIEKSELEAREKVKREMERVEAEEKKKLKDKEKSDAEEKKRLREKEKQDVREKEKLKEKERLEKEAAEKARKEQEKLEEAERQRQKKEKERLEEIEKLKQKMIAEKQKADEAMLVPIAEPEPLPAPALTVTTTTEKTTIVVVEELRKQGTNSKVILAQAAHGPPAVEDNFDRIHVLKKDGAYIPKNPELSLEQLKAFTHTNVDHDIEIPASTDVAT